MERKVIPGNQNWFSPYEDERSAAMQHAATPTGGTWYKVTLEHSTVDCANRDLVGFIFNQVSKLSLLPSPEMWLKQELALLDSMANGVSQFQIDVKLHHIRVRHTCVYGAVRDRRRIGPGQFGQDLYALYLKYDDVKSDGVNPRIPPAPQRSWKPSWRKKSKGPKKGLFTLASPTTTPKATPLTCLRCCCFIHDKV